MAACWAADSVAAAAVWVAAESEAVDLAAVARVVAYLVAEARVVADLVAEAAWAAADWAEGWAADSWRLRGCADGR